MDRHRHRRTARTDNLITRRYGPRYYRRVDSGQGQLVEASDQTLAADVVAARSLSTSDTPLRRAIRRHRSVAARHRGTNLRLFGSVARGDDEQGSDIDLVVDLPETTSLLELIALRRELAELLDAPVDVVPARSLQPEVAAAVEREAIPL